MKEEVLLKQNETRTSSETLRSVVKNCMGVSLFMKRFSRQMHLGSNTLLSV